MPRYANRHNKDRCVPADDSMVVVGSPGTVGRCGAIHLLAWPILDSVLSSRSKVAFVAWSSSNHTFTFLRMFDRGGGRPSSAGQLKRSLWKKSEQSGSTCSKD